MLCGEQGGLCECWLCPSTIARLVHLLLQPPLSQGVDRGHHPARVRGGHAQLGRHPAGLPCRRLSWTGYGM
jgi:hypothetical protein